MSRMPNHVAHHPPTRRIALQAGAIGLLGLGMNHVDGLRALAGESGRATSSRAEVRDLHFSFRRTRAARQL